MFSGIIEAIGEVKEITAEGSNKNYRIAAPFVKELKPDQSVSHNGVCLTVTRIESNSYWVTAIEETLKKSNLGKLKAGSQVNLERCISLSTLLDGHMVQGHVDTVAVCTEKSDLNGSWSFRFMVEEMKPETGWMTVPKGSITLNGVSLTVVESTNNSFSVCIIPYTYEHTNFANLLKGDYVNVEFDIVGKYIARIMQGKNNTEA